MWSVSPAKFSEYHHQFLRVVERADSEGNRLHHLEPVALEVLILR